MKFLDYIQGFRKGTSANEIEKEALADPFLADAIDGYDSIDGNHCVHIIEMQTKVQNKHLPSKTKRVLRILAAAIVFFAIFSGYLYLSEEHNYNNLIAYLDIAPEKKSAETQVAVAENKHSLVQPEDLGFTEEAEASTISSIEDIPSESDTQYRALSLGLENLKEEGMHSADLSDEAQENKDLKVSLDKKISTEQINDISADATESVAIALGRKINVENRSSSTILGEVVVSPSPSINKKTSEAIFESRERDRSVIAKGKVSEKQKPEVESTADNWFVGAGASASMYFDSKEQQSVFSDDHAVKGDYSTEKMTERSIPIIGQKNYDKYLKKNTKYPKDGKCSKIKGSVLLEFSITKTGRPINIRILESLCPELDQEAIRLVRSGSNWTASDRSVRLLIHFDGAKKDK